MDDKRKLVHRGLLPGAMLHDAEAIALALKSLIDIKSASRITALLANRNRMVENLHDSTNQGADK